MRVVTNRLPRYGVAVTTTAGAFLFVILFSPLGLRVPLALFAAAVIVSSLEGGLKPGLLATALSTAALGVGTLLLPLAQLPENHGEVVSLLVLFVIVGLLSNYLGQQCWRAVHAVEWVQAILASFGDGLIFTDAEGHVTFMNPVAHALTGWKQEEVAERLVGRLWRSADAESRHAVEKGDCPSFFGTQAVVAEPARLLSENGASQSVDAQAAAIRNRDGRLLGAVLLLRDVTAARQAERDLRQREEQFRSLAACAPAGLLQMDPECRCVYANCSCQLTGGFSADEGLGDGWARFLHAEDRARVVPAWIAAMQAGKEFTCELRFQAPQPNGRWIRLRSSPMYSDLGKLIGHIGVLHIMDDQKLAEQALQETRALLSAVAEEFGDALVVKNLEGRTLLTNSAAARMIGKTVKETVGKEEEQLVAADVASRLASGRGPARVCDPTLNGGEDCQRDYVSRETPLRDGRGNVVGLINVCREVTEEKRLLAELAKANAALELEVQARDRTLEELRLEKEFLETRLHPRADGISRNGGPESPEVSYAPVCSPSTEIVGGLAVVRE